ncbi:GAF domain-containing protein [Nostoc sp.]|uniref:GAF domain-containing protein n=1 Tax=Nostoc sp. TaxID=1180 RepID=UPI003FA59824
MSALQFLLLESNLPDAEVVQATLREGGIDCELVRVDTRAAFIRALESNAIDLILADYALSSFDEIAALTIARRLRPEIPFIFISGSLGEELAIAAIKQGATDYVLKQRLGRLVPSVQQALQEVPELDKDITKRKQALSAVDLDLRDTQLLHELSARLVTQGDIQTLYQEILAAAIALTRADAGSIQILDEATQDLLLLATQGITPAMIEHFYCVNADSNTPCGMALIRGDRTFVDFDVPESDDPHGSMRMHFEAGLLSAQSTPLISRSGKAIGMFSTHWRKHHRPSDRELRFLDLLARQAADLIEQRQGLSALRESEARFRNMADHAPVMVWISEADATCTYLSQSWYEFTGQTPATGLDFGWLNAMHPDDRNEAERIFIAANANREAFRLDYRLRRKDGSYAWAIDSAQPRFSETGEFLGYIGSVIDITDRKRAEVTLHESEAKLAIELTNVQQLQRISRSFIEEDNTGALYEQLLDAVRVIMRSDMASVQMLSPERNELFLLAHIGIAPESAKFWEWVRADDTTSCGLARSLGERILVPDVELWDFVAGTEDLTHYRLCGIRAMQSTPLVSRNGRVIGTISTHWREPHNPNERELRLLDVLARQAADLIEQRTAEAALGESEAKYRSLFESIDEGYCLIEMHIEPGEPLDYRFIETNQAFEEQSTLINAQGKWMRELRPNHEESWFEIYRDVALTGEPIRFEHGGRELENRWFTLYAFRFGQPDQRRVAVLFNDITDRKRSEEQLRRAAEMDAFRVNLSDALRSLSDCAEIQGEAARLLREQLDVGWCYYNEFDETGTVATILQDAVKEGLPSAVGVHDLSDVPEFTDWLHSGSIFNVSNFATFSLFNRRVVERYASIGMHSVLGAPLVKNGRLIAVFLVADTSPREWTDEAIALLQDVAERTWAAVERARAEESLRESEAKYRSLFENVNDGFCIIQMLYDNGQPINYRFLEVNPAFETQSGFKQVIGKTAYELTPNLEAVAFTNYETVLTTGEPIEFEILPIDTGRYLRVAAYPYGDSQNKQLAIIFSDITERKRREHHQSMLSQISQELVGLENIPETMNHLSEMIGRYFEVTQCVFTELTADFEIAIAAYGWNAQGIPSVKGTYRMRDFLTDEQIAANMAGEASIVNDTQTDPRVSAERYGALGIRSFVIVPLVRDNVWQFMISIIDNKPRQWREDEIDLIREITSRIWTRLERARAEDAMRESEIQRMREQAAREEERQRAESLAELDRAKTLFFSNVSHEFRTPLTLILAPVQNVLSDSVNPLTSLQREQLKLVHRNSLRLLKLVNTLLDFSRIEADRLKANYEPTDLSTYTAELASVFRSAIENANLELVVDCPPLPDPIYVDREMWEKIVLNLLSNALKFTFDGMISVSLKLVQEEVGSRGAGEQGSRGAGEQGRVILQVLSPLPLCPSAPLPLCPSASSLN